MEYKIEDYLPLVKELIDKYTGHESTSVTYETASQLMESILYCINENSNWPSTVPASSTAPPNARTMYNSGYELVIKRTRRTKMLYEIILKDFEDYGNEAFRDTVLKAIPGFFVRYDPRFAPQNHIITLDYPVLENLTEFSGIDVIWKYLSCIRREQVFLSRYSHSYVTGILSHHHGSYESLFINLTSIVLHNLLGWLISGEKPVPSPLPQKQLTTVKKFIDSQSRPDLESHLNNYIDTLVTQIYDGTQELSNYLKLDTPSFASQLKNASKHNSLLL